MFRVRGFQGFGLEGLGLSGFEVLGLSGNILWPAGFGAFRASAFRVLGSDGL